MTIAGIELPDAQALTLDLQQFRNHLRLAAQSQRREQKEIHSIPRGAFQVRALIDVCGSEITMTIDVIAIYDPALRKYIQTETKIWQMRRS